MNNLTQQTVKELLDYNPISGKLYWKERDVKLFKDGLRFKAITNCRRWNSRYAGNEAFTSLGNHGYNTGSIFNIKYLAHRIIWLWMTGEWPEEEIDHDNHIRLDNRWENLKEASSSENSKNLSLVNTNKSGVVGVHWFKRDSCWQAQITTNRRRHHLGYFSNFDDAVKARKNAEKLFGFHPNHGKVLI